MSRASSGISILDEDLEGGFPEGSLIMLEAQPDSQSDLLLYEFMTPRPTLYISTQRSKDAVTAAFNRSNTDTSNVTVSSVPRKDGIDAILPLLEDIEDGSTVIVDKSDWLEDDISLGDYHDFLRALQNKLLETDSIGILHASSGDGLPSNRGTTRSFADGVLQLTTTVEGDDIENRLAILKLRGGPTLDDTIKLHLEDEVRIDRTRDIA